MSQRNLFPEWPEPILEGQRVVYNGARVHLLVEPGTLGRVELIQQKPALLFKVAWDEPDDTFSWMTRDEVGVLPR